MFSIEKQLIRLVHVIALAALHQEEGANKIKAKKELKKYAFPEEIELWFVNVANNGSQKTVGLKHGIIIVDIALQHYILNAIRKY